MLAETGSCFDQLIANHLPNHSLRTSDLGPVSDLSYSSTDSSSLAAGLLIAPGSFPAARIGGAWDWRDIGCHEGTEPCALRASQELRIMSAGQDMLTEAHPIRTMSIHMYAKRPTVPKERQPPGPDIADAPIDPRPIAGPESIFMQRVMQWLERDSAPTHTVTNLCKNEWSRAREGSQGMRARGWLPRLARW